MPGGRLQSLNFIVFAVGSLGEGFEKGVGSASPFFPEGNMGSHMKMMLNPPSSDLQKLSSVCLLPPTMEGRAFPGCKKALSSFLPPLEHSGLAGK